jgi:hypothetical protein
MKRRSLWRRWRHALADFPLDRWLEGHYVYEWRDGKPRRGRFYTWGQGGIMHPDERPCACADLDGPIAEQRHPLIQRDDYRNRADHWRSLVADWYHVNFGLLGRLVFDDSGKPTDVGEPTLMDRMMTWLVGKPFSHTGRVTAPHRSKDSIYASDREKEQ